MKIGVTLALAVVLGGFALAMVMGSTQKSLQATLSMAAPQTLAHESQGYIFPTYEPNYLPIRNFNLKEPEVAARSAILVDGKTGRVLYAQNENARLPIASITKLMTAITVIDTLNLDDEITIPPAALNVDGNGTDFSKGEVITGNDLFKIMLIKSSNDAAVAFAESARLHGVDLVAKMNDRARELGMTHTYFSDPTGLEDTKTYSTASDLILLAREVDRYPLIWKTLRIPKETISTTNGAFTHVVDSTNQLLSQIDHIIGGKTGNTTGALGTMLLEVSVGDTQDFIVSVVLGSKDRFGETKKLINWGLQAHQWTP